MKMDLKLLILIFFNFAKSQETDQISVALVVDATGSMGEEIQQLKNAFDEFFSNSYKQDKKLISNYVLSVFRDPDVGPLKNSADPKVIVDELNITQATGGGDCDELLFTGIDEALQHTLPKSLMFVLTDAPPKDRHLKDSVLSKLREKQITVFFLLTEGCGSASEKEIYKEIARETSGLVLDLKEADMKKTLETFNPLFEEKLSPVESKSLDAGNHKTKFEVSADDTELIIQTTAYDIIVYGPDRVVYRPKAIGDDYKYLNILDLKPGTYEMDTKFHESYSVLVEAISNIKFAYGFSLAETTLKDKTVNQPYQGQKNHLMVFVSGTGAGELEQLDSVVLTVEETSTITDLHIIRNKNVYATDLIDFPSEEFKLSVSGTDNSGNKILRVLSNSIKHTTNAPPPKIKPNLTPEQMAEIDALVKSAGLPMGLARILKRKKFSVDEVKKMLSDTDFVKVLEKLDSKPPVRIYTRPGSVIRKKFLLK